jgi:uncharacterized protein with beta-barrel porin domain
MISASGAGIVVGGSLPTGASIVVSTFSGGISNSGTISAGGPGILVGGNSSVSGSANSSVGITTFAGGISNSGTISSGGAGIEVGGDPGASFIVTASIVVSTFSGGISNSGTISATGAGILVGGDPRAQTTSATASVSISTFSGGITNTGTISASDGILVGGDPSTQNSNATASVLISAFAGGISNGAAITVSGDGILVGGNPSASTGTQAASVTISSFAGGITNRGTITAGGDGIIVGGDPSANYLKAASIIISTFSGGITNIGTISASGDGIVVGGNPNAQRTLANASIVITTFSGGISNSGLISAGGNGIFVGGNPVANMSGIATVAISVFSGGISNSGTISASGNGIFIGGNPITTQSGNAGVVISTFSGGVTNIGMISAGGTGIYVNNVSSFTGAISNAGTISAAVNGIFIGTGVTFAAGSGIFNSGTIIGATSAIDASTATSPVTINQTAGLISGNILLSTNADVLNVSGGTINGNIVGAGTTNTLNFVLGSGTFTYGNSYSFTGINQLNVNSGTVILNGANSATNVAVNAGTLEVGDAANTGATLTSTDGVNVFGTLAGHGTVIGNVDIQNGGTLSPGGSIGTLTITGSLIFSPTSFYNVQITPTSNSLTLISGTTTIQGGTVNVAAGSGTYAVTRYTILTSTGGRTGTFSGVTSNFAFLMPTLTYDANDVYLNISAGTGAVVAANGTLVPNYRTAAATNNQLAVAGALTNAAIRNNDTGPILTALNQLTVTQAQAAFNSLSGEGIAAADTLGVRANQVFNSSMADQTAQWSDGAPSSGNSVTLTEAVPGILNYAATDSMKSPIVVHDPAPVIRTWHAWASGFGLDENVHGQATGLGTASQIDQLYGGAMGVDYQIAPNILVGLAGGGSNGNFSVAGRATSGSVEGGHVGAYSIISFGSFYGSSTISGSFYRNLETRIVAGFGGLAGETDRGSFDSRAVRTRLEIGDHVTSIWGASVTPFVALEIADLRSGGFNEAPLSGPGNFALNVQGRDTASVPAYIGVRFGNVMNLGYGMNLRPIVSVAYGHDFAPERILNNDFLALPDAAFQIDGARIARDFAQTKAGFELAISTNAVIFADFEGEFAGRDQLYGGKGGIKMTW